MFLRAKLLFMNINMEHEYERGIKTRMGNILKGYSGNPIGKGDKVGKGDKALPQGDVLSAACQCTWLPKRGFPAKLAYSRMWHNIR